MVEEQLDSIDTMEEHCEDTSQTADFAPLLDSTILETSSMLLHSMSSPHRIQILIQLEHRPCCVHELVSVLDLPQPAVSQHLRVLKNAGVVTSIRRGREHEYRLADQHVCEILNDAINHAAGMNSHQGYDR